MERTKEAKKELSRVPFFVRKKVKKKVEDYACEKMAKIVESSHLHEARNRFLSRMEDEVKGYRIEVCFAGRNCENGIDVGKDLPDKIENLLESKEILEFLKANTTGKIKFHQEFKVSISFCPNSCSRPQIVDLGIIAAQIPFVGDNECIKCNLCVSSCRDKAISFLNNSDSPFIDMKKCLYCGACIKECPTKTIITKHKGFRILLGGKLGRHPRLGIELDGLFIESQVLAIIDNASEMMLSQKDCAKRFAEIFKPENIIELMKGV